MMPAAPRSRARPTRSRSDDCGRTMAAIGVAADRVQEREEVGLGRCAVLEVEDDPVEAGLAAQLGGQGDARSENDADERLAGADARSKVGHRRDDAGFAWPASPDLGCGGFSR